MPRMMVNGVSLAYEEYGEGFPLVWCHDYTGSMDSWKPQIHHFSRRYRVIVYNARGYPPSDVPTDPEAYDQEKSVDDLYHLLGRLGITRAYVGGVSMGGAIAYVFALRHPEAARAIVVASAGTGSTDPAAFRETQRTNADELEQRGIDALTERAESLQPQLKVKDPLAWQQLIDQYLAHSPLGLALTARGVQAKRPPVFEFADELRQMQTPALIVIGDEDEPCLEPALFLRRTLPNSGLVVFPRTGHLVHLEEPELFNRSVSGFLTMVEAGKWPGSA
jgi:pimeloyl-ACP methyl ester carboxylesterase